MNYFKVKSAGMISNKLITIEIECVQQRRLPFLQIIGGPSGALSAQRERIMAALDSSGFKLPSRRITVSIAGAFPGVGVESADLAVALAILGSSGAFSQEKIKNFLVCGGLSLDGKLHSLASRAPLREWLEKNENIPAILPWDDSQILSEAREGGGFTCLNDVVSFLRGESSRGGRRAPLQREEVHANESIWSFFAKKPVAQRLLQVAAAGRHPILVTGGHEGDQKVVAEAVNCLSPPMKTALMEEVAAIHRSFGENLGESRPFRLVRADQAARLFRFDAHSGLWGDISLAHGGVLYLQELGEKPLSILQRLHEPLDTGAIRSFRGGQAIRQPADWALAAGTTLCPCGGSGMQNAFCRCIAGERERFRQRLDQVRPFFHLHYHSEESGDQNAGISFTLAKSRVAKAASLAEARGASGARLSLEQVFRAKPWSEEALGIWRSSKGPQWGGLSANMAKVALTVSDLREAEEVSRDDILEARHYVPSPFGSISRSGRSFSSSGETEMNSTAIP